MREAIFLLALGSVTAGMALRIMEPMLPRLAAEFGTSVSATATVITAFAVGYAGGQLLHGPIGDRFGKLRVATICLFGAALGSLGCALVHDVASLAALRFIAAVFASASTVLGMAYIGDSVPVGERQPVVARFIGGTIIGRHSDHWRGVAHRPGGLRGTFLVIVALVFAAVSMILFLRTRTMGQTRALLGRQSVHGLSAGARSAAVRMVVSTGSPTDSFFGAYSFLGAFLKLKFDLSLTAIGAILAGFGVGGVLYTLIVRRLLLALGQRGLVFWGGAICCGSYAIIALSPVWRLPCNAVALGFSFSCAQHRADQGSEMAPQARGAGVSVYASTWSLGQAAGVAVMGVAVSALDYAPAIIGFGAGFLALGVWMRANLQRL
jgi:predicted MFS family arabinose efflux permease